MSAKTESTGYDRRVEEIKQIRKEHRPFYILLGAIVGVLVGLGLGAFLFDGGAVTLTESGYAVNVYTEILGIVVTVLIIGWWDERRSERREYERLKNALRSPVSVIAVDAIRLLRESGEFDVAVAELTSLKSVQWAGANLSSTNLNDAHLNGANLDGANMNGARLQHTHLLNTSLEGAGLLGAQLQHARLHLANLKSALLEQAQLEHARLLGADLSGARLGYANLHGSELDGANMEGTSLIEANLQGAKIDEETKFNSETRLPDGTYWTEDTDMRRFTESEHKHFWRSDNDFSPAYKDDETSGA